MDCDTCWKRQDIPYKCFYPDHGWVDVVEICYCREQVKWFLEHIETLQTGRYPDQPVGLMVGSRGGKNERTPFSSPVEISAEVKYRLERTGRDGRELLQQIRLHYSRLDNEPYRALTYMSGRHRKRQSYQQWYENGHVKTLPQTCLGKHI